MIPLVQGYTPEPEDLKKKSSNNISRSRQVIIVPNIHVKSLFAVPESPHFPAKSQEPTT